MSKYWWLEKVSLGCYNIRNKDIGYCTIQFYNLQWGGVSLSHFKVFWWKKTLNFFLLMIKVFSRTTSHILSFFVSMFTHFNHLHLNWNEEWHCYEIFCCDIFERQTMLLPPTPTRASSPTPTQHASTSSPWTTSRNYSWLDWSTRNSWQ